MATKTATKRVTHSRKSATTPAPHQTATAPRNSAPAVKPKQMTKTEAYRLVKVAREGLRDADEHIWKGTAAQAREDLMDTLGAVSQLLSSLNHEGINGLK
jgi:hypothetical protein